MTQPDPPTDPILMPAQLGRWAEESPLTRPDFAELVLQTISELLRHYGDSYWTAATIPARARDIGYFVARNYYLNPDLPRQESTGPLQETRDNKVLQGIDFTPEQQAEIAGLAANAPGQAVDGLWAMSTTRGPLETGRQAREGTVVVWDTRGAWPIEYLAGEDRVVFEPEV